MSSLTSSKALISYYILPLIVMGFLFTSYYSSSVQNFYSRCQTDIKQVYINGNSMSELYKSGQTVAADFGYYNCNDVQRKDVVILKHAPNIEFVIKSILLIPGDEFYIRGYQKGFHLIVNNDVLLTPSGRPYLFPASAERVLRYYEKNYSGRVPDNLYFAFGTQFNGSLDSSTFGPISRKELIAKVANFQNQ